MSVNHPVSSSRNAFAALKSDAARSGQRAVVVERRYVGGFCPNIASGAELVLGSGNFVAPKTLEVQLNDGGTRRLTGDKVFINVGSRAAIPSVPGPRKRGRSRMSRHWTWIMHPRT